MTAAQYILAAVSCGLSVADLDRLSIGLVLDVLLEKTGDGYTEISGSEVDDFFGG